MPIQEKIFKRVIPESLNDPNYEEFEYLLCWYGRKGSLIVKMFTDFENNQQNTNTILNISNPDKIQNIIESETRSKTLSCEDISLNDLKVISSILSSKIVLRIFKDGSFQKIGINSNSFNYKESNKRYNLTFNIVEYERRLER